MAKIIKCPTCSSPIQVSPQSVGQIVKCPGCGKGIKLVAKKPASPASGAPSATRAPSATTRNTSSMSGSMNETYRSIAGEPVTDGPPAIDGGCARCGKLVDEADLVEDDGQLVCKECAIASAADRHAGEGPIGDAPPAYIPTRRGRIINFTPMFFVFCFFALVWGGTQIYLNMVPEPKGTKSIAAASAIPTPHLPSLSPATEPAESPTTSPSQPLALEPAKPAATQPAAIETSASEASTWERTNKQAIQQKLELARNAADAGKRKEALQLYQDALTFIGDRKLTDPTLQSEYARAVSERDQLSQPPEPTPAPATTAPSDLATAAGEHPATEPASAPLVPTDPVLRGLQQLKNKKYADALETLDNVRARTIRADQRSLTDREKALLRGIAAAAIGAGHPDKGRFAADLAYDLGDRTRSLVLNRAQEHLAAHTGPKDLAPISLSVKAVMGSHEGDELAADIFGTILERLSDMPMDMSSDRATLDSFRAYLHSYNEHLASQHPGQTKWGIEWLPSDDVKNYRLVEGTATARSVVALWNKVEMDKVRASFLASEVEQGQRAGRDVSKLQAQLDETKQQLESDKATANAMKHSYYPPQWLEDFQPVLPDAN